MATIGGAGAPPPPPPGGDKNTPGGHNNGFLKPTRGKKREQKMKWKEGDNDRKLLLIGLGREVAPREYPVIAASYPEGPTDKAVQERLAKLRREQLQLLGDLGLNGPSTTIHPALPENGSAEAVASFLRAAFNYTTGDARVLVAALAAMEADEGEAVDMMQGSFDTPFTPRTQPGVEEGVSPARKAQKKLSEFSAEAVEAKRKEIKAARRAENARKEQEAVDAAVAQSLYEEELAQQAQRKVDTEQEMKREEGEGDAEE